MGSTTIDEIKAIVRYRRYCFAAEKGQLCDSEEKISNQSIANPGSIDGAKFYDTVLAQHCAYFDRDRDGIIWPLDTYHVCREWGWSVPIAFFFAGAIHFVQSYGTAPGILPDPYWRIWVKNMSKNKHGSSTLSFDKSGDFDRQNLATFILNNDRDRKGGLTKREVWRGLKDQAMPLDLFGQVSAFFEWFFTYVLLWPEDGIMRADDIIGVCEGSTFFDKARSERQKHQPWFESKSQPTPCQDEHSNGGRALISSTIVFTIIGPAIAAGACYFVLRFLDDVSLLLPKLTVRHLKRNLNSEEPTSKNNPSPSSTSESALEEYGGSAGGLVGLLILLGTMKLVIGGTLIATQTAGQ